MSDLWDVALYSMIDIDRRFGGVDCLHRPLKGDYTVQHQGRQTCLSRCRENMECYDDIPFSSMIENNFLSIWLE